jgi:signal transduction histidine kinase
MASPALDIRERGQDTIVDAWPNRELREANRRMHDFLAVLWHELRSPLTAIRNALQVLGQQGVDASMRENVRGLMERQTQCISHLIDDER